MYSLTHIALVGDCFPYWTASALVGDCFHYWTVSARCLLLMFPRLTLNLLVSTTVGARINL